MKKYGYLALLFLIGLVFNENMVQWALAVRVGGYTLAHGFEDAFESFTFWGYYFCTLFRLMPYFALALVLKLLSKTKWKDYFIPVFLGGLAGILGVIIWGLWEALLPFYTDEHVSSTTAISFLFIPMYALFTGAIGAILCAGIYTPIRYVLRKGKTVEKKKR